MATFQKKVIDRKYLPSRLPVTGTAFWIFILHQYHAPGWLWGVIGTIFVVTWITVIAAVILEERVKPTEVV